MIRKSDNVIFGPEIRLNPFIIRITSRMNMLSSFISSNSQYGFDIDWTKAPSMNKWGAFLLNKVEVGRFIIIWQCLLYHHGEGNLRNPPRRNLNERIWSCTLQFFVEVRKHVKYRGYRYTCDIESVSGRGTAKENALMRKRCCNSPFMTDQSNRIVGHSDHLTKDIPMSIWTVGMECREGSNEP